MTRALVIVLDSVGVGALPDADRYGDAGTNTLVHVAEAVGGLHLPHLGRLGLGNILAVPGVAPEPRPLASYGKMAERSAGKDTTSGHWELMGLILDRPFPVYPDGFPPEIIGAFEQAIGRPVLGNRPASGTEIIAELGEQHLRTGYPIVYTSADSVFQIAAHEEVIPVEDLYRYCLIARRLLAGKHGVGRVIARPFLGRPGAFYRTARRRDFSLPPPRPTLLDRLKEHGHEVVGIGKIEDIFAGRGLTRIYHTEDNQDGVAKTLEALKQSASGLVFTNLVDYDMLYGHRNDPVGYARALEQFDARVPEIISALRPRDFLVITADHGCDPTTPGTDHTREYVPLLALVAGNGEARDLGTRETFADVAATLAEVFGLPAPEAGTSFWGEMGDGLDGGR
ncbi:MAG: phosphopentomutase [Clostridia bacterium]|nr:phosphopentomutase [Clostridia bacterium]MDH7572688.1 phosphopentomutase [Clostridia bacterium]